MPAAEHDRALALTSHLPHAAAAALAATLPETYFRLTGSGFDTTRLASGDPELWKQIFTANRANVLAALEKYLERLTTLVEAIRQGDDKTLEELSLQRNGTAMLWEIDIYPREGQPDLNAQRVAADAADLGLAKNLEVHAAHGYLIQGEFDRKQIEQLAQQLLADSVVERTVVAPAGDAVLNPPVAGQQLIHVLPSRA